MQRFHSSYWLTATLFVALLLVLGCQKEQATCPSIPCPPIHVNIELKPPLAQPGLYHLEVAVDGRSERCTLDLQTVVPAKTEPKIPGVVRGPRTRTKSSCKELKPGNITNDGHIANLRLEGKPASINIRFLKEGRLLGGGQFKPNYKPARLHGIHCPPCTMAEVTLKLLR